MVGMGVGYGKGSAASSNAHYQDHTSVLIQVADGKVRNGKMLSKVYDLLLYN